MRERDERFGKWRGRMGRARTETETGRRQIGKRGQNRVYKDGRGRKNVDVQIQQSANPLFGIAFFAIVPPPGALPVVLIARGAVVTSARARSWRRALVLFWGEEGV